MSWSVPGTLIRESTESESKAGLDRFYYTLFSEREEIARKKKKSCHFDLIVGAPHPPSLLMGDASNKLYLREYASFPASWLRASILIHLVSISRKILESDHNVVWFIH
ncbi:unnamed protein product [Musa acuminata subsp. malaccensis]|uniref:(wild Malaysian banana) hypothetical protein n=1 Tax=Musa acuminata subsp. malaccensis TaxID=214687 RepID=A0A804K378_MUSAM|nr:unnamed protein product [Musa acuminata subsp. malaccensis]